VIDFRYHVVSIVAVFLALTVGIVLGSSFLKESIVQELTNQANGLRTDVNTLRQEKRELERDIQYRDAFVRQVAPTLMRNRLEDQRVVLVTLPGADSDITEGIKKLLADASGANAKITGQVAVKGEFSEDKQQTTLGTLALQLKPSGVAIPDGSAQETAAAEIADAIVTTEPARAGEEGTSASLVLGGFKEAGFIDVEGSPQNRATLAVVVAPSVPSTSSENNKKANEAYLAVLSALGKASRGAVLAGPEQAAEDGGLIAALRASKDVAGQVSSVDVADTESGRVAVALALLAEAQGKAGHYGVHDTPGGPLPPVAAQSGG
jgi:hypothetical protein